MASYGGPNSGSTFFQQDGELYFWKANKQRVGPFTSEKEMHERFEIYQRSEQFIQDVEQARGEYERKKTEDLRKAITSTPMTGDVKSMARIIHDLPGDRRDRLLAILLVQALRSYGARFGDEVFELLMTE